jgi:ribulose-phosphate 3-epimerase
MPDHDVLILPSLLSCDFARIGEEVAAVEAAGADALHVDVMDGHFVPNLTLGPPVVKAIHRVARIPLDVHLMIDEPLRYAADYVAAGASWLTFHAEAPEVAGDLPGAVARMRSAGAPRVGVSIKPGTPAQALIPILADVDLVLVMSVEPGFGGQSFMPEVLPKLRELRALGFSGRLEMDGGLAAGTIPSCAEAGCDMIVAGSAIFGSEDLAATISHFRSLAEGARAGEALP